MYLWICILGVPTLACLLIYHCWSTVGLTNWLVAIEPTLHQPIGLSPLGQHWTKLHWTNVSCGWWDDEVIDLSWFDHDKMERLVWSHVWNHVLMFKCVPILLDSHNWLLLYKILLVSLLKYADQFLTVLASTNQWPHKNSLERWRLMPVLSVTCLLFTFHWRLTTKRK